MTGQHQGTEGDRSLPPGYQLDEYVIQRPLGSGGFGITYLGEDLHLGRKVAVKEYFPFHLAGRSSDSTVSPNVRTQESLGEYQWGLERFVDEARTLAKFEHPNVIRVVRYLQRNATAYIVMEFADGKPLSQVIRDGGPLNEPEIRQILLPLMDGLQVVHAAGMLHRDIKPQNIIVRQDGSPVLIDFGAARQAIGSRSKSISTILTPGYAPMEQYYSRGNQGPWTDIYALGAVAYACLLASPPPEAPELQKMWPEGTLARVARGRASPAFLEAIDWAMMPEELDRPQNIAAWRPVVAGQAPGPAVRSMDTPTILPQHRSGAKPGSAGPGMMNPAAVEQRRPKRSIPAVAMAAIVGVVAFAIVGAVILGTGSDKSTEADSGQTTTAQSSAPPIAQPAPPSTGIPPTQGATIPQQGTAATQQPPVAATFPQVPSDPLADRADDDIYAIAQRIGTPEAYEIYLKLYPAGRHSDRARAILGGR